MNNTPDWGHAFKIEEVDNNTNQPQMKLNTRDKGLKLDKVS